MAKGRGCVTCRARKLFLFLLTLEERAPATRARGHGAAILGEKLGVDIVFAAHRAASSLFGGGEKILEVFGNIVFGGIVSVVVAKYEASLPITVDVGLGHTRAEHLRLGVSRRMHSPLAEILFTAKRVRARGTASRHELIRGAKGRGMKKLEGIGCSRVLGIAEGRRGRFEAKLGGYGRWPGSCGEAGGVGDAIGVERSWHWGIENGQSLAISRRKSQSIARGAVAFGKGKGRLGGVAVVQAQLMVVELLTALV